MVQHVCGVLKDFVAELLTAFLTGHAGHIGLAGCIGACIKGGDVRVLGGYDIHLIKGNAGGFRRHLGEHGVRALADFSGAHTKLHGSVLV